MNIFDKTLINLHRGFERLKLFASIFSERVRVELNIIRIRIRMENLQERIRSLHESIGKRYVDLHTVPDLPERDQTSLLDEEITAAMAELVQRKKELSDLEDELKREQALFTPGATESEDTII